MANAVLRRHQRGNALRANQRSASTPWVRWPRWPHRAAEPIREFDSYGWGPQPPGSELRLAGPVGARITAAIGAAAWRASVEEHAAVIVVCTNTGATARAIARLRPAAPSSPPRPSL